MIHEHEVCVCGCGVCATCMRSRVHGAIGRGLDDARGGRAEGLWAAYDRYRERLAGSSSVPDGTDERPGGCDA